MRENNLTVKPNTRLIAKRVSERPKPKPDKPKQWWGIDMTKVYNRYGWVYVVIVLDWYTKKIVGHYSGDKSYKQRMAGSLRERTKRESSPEE